MYMRTICVYKITNPIGKVYIGATTNFEKRKLQYKNLHCKTQKKILQSLSDYGYESHQIEIIEECDLKNLHDLERQYITQYNSVVDGLNCVNKGAEISICEETRRLFSDNKKGYKNPNFGRSTWNKGIKQWENKPHPFLGKKLSEEHKAKMKNANSKIYALGADNMRAVKINQFTKDGIFIKTWGSSMDIHRELKIDSSSVIKNCKGKLKKCKGYIFQYAN